jgi:hypothetical protein
LSEHGSGHGYWEVFFSSFVTDHGVLGVLVGFVCTIKPTGSFGVRINNGHHAALGNTLLSCTAVLAL